MSLLIIVVDYISVYFTRLVYYQLTDTVPISVMMWVCTSVSPTQCSDLLQIKTKTFNNGSQLPHNI